MARNIRLIPKLMNLAIWNIVHMSLWSLLTWYATDVAEMRPLYTGTSEVSETVLRKKKNSIITLPDKGGHSRLVPQNYVPSWEGVARGFIGLAQKTGLIKVSVLFFIPRSSESSRPVSVSQVIVSGVFWVIVSWPFLWKEDCFQGRGLGSVSITKENTPCNITLTGK